MRSKEIRPDQRRQPPSRANADRAPGCASCSLSESGRLAHSNNRHNFSRFVWKDGSPHARWAQGQMPNELSSPDSDLLYEADYLSVFIKLKSFQASH